MPRVAKPSQNYGGALRFKSKTPAGYRHKGIEQNAMSGSSSGLLQASLRCPRDGEKSDSVMKNARSSNISKVLGFTRKIFDNFQGYRCCWNNAPRYFDDFHDFWEDLSFFQKKINNSFGFYRFLRKSGNFIGRITNTHILPNEVRRNFFFAKVSSFHTV